MKRLCLTTLLLAAALPCFGQGPNGGALERRPYRFDAGGPESSVAEGAVLLTPADRYEAARGYGWTEAPERAFVRPGLRRSRDAFTLDGVAGMQVAFRADVPDGTWWVTLLVEAGLEDASTMAITLGGEPFAPAWQRFNPPAERRTQIQKIYRLLHRPVEVADGALRFELTGGADTVRVLGFSLLPEPAAATAAQRALLDRLATAGRYGSGAPLDPLVAELRAQAARDPADAFAAYWLEQVERLRQAERYREQMGWESVKDETGLGIFDRYHGAVMLLDGLLDRPGAEDGPLYERALFERGRLLHWLALERGGPDERAAAERDLRALAARHPEDDLLAMYTGRKVDAPHACDRLAPAPNAPAWSAMQLEALCRMRAETQWWVRERQIENGELGGKLGDDVELLREWHPLLAFGDTVALRGLRRLADGVWHSDQIEDGYAAEVSDVEHASEFIADTAPAMALFSGDPAYIDRLRPSARHFENLWTGITPQGRRFFRSAWFSASEIETAPPKNRDVNYNTRAAKALRFLAHQTGDAHVAGLLHEWSSAWVHAAGRTDKGKPAGLPPASVRFPDEAINGDEPTWYDPQMYWNYFRWAHDAGSSILDQLHHTYLLTGDAALLEPLFAALDLVRAHEAAAAGGEALAPGSPAWAAAHLRGEPGFWAVVEAWRLRSDDDRYDDLVLRHGTSYARYRLTGDEAHLAAGLEPLLETLRHNVPLRTTEVLHTDRVYYPGSDHLQAMLAGGGTELSPYLAVSWSDADSLLTALVADAGPERLAVVLFSHADAPRTVGMHPHALAPGRYVMTRAAGGGAAEETTVTLRERAGRVDVPVPPRVPVTLTLEAAAADAAAPGDVARRVADRLVAETRLELVPALEEAAQGGAYAVDFADALGPADGGVYYARAVVRVDSSAPATALLGLSHTPGALEVRLGGEVVYRGTDGDAAHTEHLDYDLIRYEHAAPVTLAPGEHELRVKMAPSDEAARVVLGFVHPATGITTAGVALHAPHFEENEHFAFLLIGPFEGGLDAVHPPDTAAVVFGTDYAGLSDASEQAGERRVRWDKPRVHVVSTIPEPLDYSDWRYFTGTFLDALLAVGRTFEGLDYADYVDRHLDSFLAHRDAVARERAVFGLRESAFGHYFRFALLDDMGMQTVPFVERLRRGAGTAADSALVRRVVDHVVDDARRLPDGTFARLNPDSLTVWADDLFMGTVVLIRAADVLGRPALLDEAARQALLMHEKLYHPETGLYWHGWFDRTQSPSSSKWARANGWTMMAKTELLQALPEDHPLYDDVLQVFRAHAAGLVRAQAADGRWHQVLDNPATYLETSATAMFVRAFAEGVRQGWLPEEPYRAAAERGWAAVARQVRPDGRVEGIVRGTPIFYSDEQYDVHAPRLNDPRGLGAVLYAATAVERMRRAAR